VALLVIFTELLRKQAAGLRKLAEGARGRGDVILAAHSEEQAVLLDDRIWQLEHQDKPDDKPDAAG
jgi:hypothetical protein